MTGPAAVAGPDGVARCWWAGEDPLYIAYHDREWGRPVRDDRRLFEFLILEGAQAGLSWLTVLRKREGYRRAFAGFDPEAVARYGARERAALLRDPGIVRNRLKIASATENARAFLEVRREFGSFTRYLRGVVGAEVPVRRPRNRSQVPARTEASDALSEDLKARGFRFVGSTICYAFLQACGFVDDHAAGCSRAR